MIKCTKDRFIAVLDMYSAKELSINLVTICEPPLQQFRDHNNRVVAACDRESDMLKGEKVRFFIHD